MMNRRFESFNYKVFTNLEIYKMEGHSKIKSIGEGIVKNSIEK